jgi:beta-galactosidase/beta-glucuronidase
VAAAENDGSYPRPQLVRRGWKSLDGAWAFAFDDDRAGQRERWFDVDAEDRFPSTITVPFPPESRASGVHDTGFHPVVWYRRPVTPADLLSGDSSSDRTLLHFGAVDHHAHVWFDGVLVGEHSGGQTPFHVDVTDLLGNGRDEHVLVVRAEDDPLDAALPRGKQDWEPAPHGIWYHRTTGIWQSVWTETVPELHLLDVAWVPQVAASSVTCEIELSARPTAPVEAEVLIQLNGEDIAHHVIRLDGPRAVATISLPGMANGQDRARFLWSPEHPVLFDAQVTLRSPGAPPASLDEVTSYFGMRSAAVGRGHFLLNGHPYYMRSVLDQGYWRDTHLANPGSSWLREEIELMKQMGFNAVRKHQKAEDPRFLYWADRLGLLVWGETANAYEYSTTAVELLTREWLDLVRRDRSHPSIVAWVPLNESWGVQDIAGDRAQQAYAGGLAQLTRALDPSRPVMSNEGWEHVDSDILGLHDYSSSAETLVSRYGNAQSVRDTLDSHGPSGRIPLLTQAQRARFDAGDAPLMITEFGGISFASTGESWGYSTVRSEDEYAQMLDDIFDALRACPEVVGFCYTQLLDTEQETNGLLTVDRKPKLPLERIREIVTGRSDGGEAPTSTMGWVSEAAATATTPGGDDDLTAG